MNKAFINISKVVALVATAGLYSCGGSSSEPQAAAPEPVAPPVAPPATPTPPVTPPPVTTPPVTPPMTIPGTDWNLVWSDEFDSATVNTANWNYEVNCEGGGNNEKQCYTDSGENSFLADGLLNIVARPAAAGASQPYTSARLTTQNKAAFKYGRFEIRAKMPFGQGSWPAIWMMPNDSVYGGWPRSGEIDIMEAVNLKTVSADGVVENNVHGTLHYGRAWPNNASSGKAYPFPDATNPADDFHTYAVEWEEGEIRWYVDDYLYATQLKSEIRLNDNGEAIGLTHKGWFTEYVDAATGELANFWGNEPFDQSFFFILNVAVGGNWPENVNNLGIDASAFENGQSMQVDYVRVYQCALDTETGAGCATTREGYKDLDDALVEGAAPAPALSVGVGAGENAVIFSDDVVTNWVLWDCCSGTTPTIEQDDADNGAVAQFTIGEAPTVMGFISREEFLSDDQQAAPFDVSSALATGVISFDLQVVTPPLNADSVWMFKVESVGAASAVELPLSSSQEGATPVVGEWATHTFGLQTLANLGLDLSQIDALLVFPAWDTGNGAVYRLDNMMISE